MKRRTVTCPRIVHVSTVAPDILSIEIHAGDVAPHRIVPYKKQKGDRIVSCREGKSVLERGGKKIAWVIGPRRDHLCRFERITGTPLDETHASDCASYTIQSPDDPAYRRGARPVAVFRKSKPRDWSRPSKQFAMRHFLYLKLPRALKHGAVYRIELKNVNVGTPRVEYVHCPEKTISEAVHVSQVGFRPDDPVKCAFLSIWLGTGGAYAFDAGKRPRFFLIDEKNGRRRSQGTVCLVKNATDVEIMREKKNHNHTAVYRMDFSAFSRPGTYRVYVEGVGCGMSFDIGERVWGNAFAISMKGFYHMRSGIELGRPYTDYRRPRCYHPADGMKIYHSTAPLMETGNGLNVHKTDKSNFGNLVAGKTARVVTNAWGGYHDAADWDRRIQHLDPSRQHLELFDLFPGYFQELNLNIPESGNGIPDIINEALWNIDCYRRMQLPDGGIRGGIEAEEHPNPGETSWFESLKVMTYAPGMWSSHFYASVAARAAVVLRRAGSPCETIYRQSALRAMRWAEKEWKRLKKDPAISQNNAVINTRNLAALEIFRLTGECQWHRVFMEHSCLKDNLDEYHGRQADALFVYARLKAGLCDPRLRKKARQALVTQADAVVEYARHNAFNLASPFPGRTIKHGFYSVPQAKELLRAWHLTKKKHYLETAVAAAQFSAGANPMNMTYTTGVGRQWPRHPMHLDSRNSGQPAPRGITVYGQGDNEYWRAHESEYMLWMIRWYLDKACTPSAWVWPPVESYFDLDNPPASSEYTPQQTMGNNSYVWGILAARAVEQAS